MPFRRHDLDNHNVKRKPANLTHLCQLETFARAPLTTTELVMQKISRPQLVRVLHRGIGTLCTLLRQKYYLPSRFPVSVRIRQAVLLNDDWNCLY